METGVTEIGSVAFSNCENLVTITLPDGLKTIGNGAFEFCKSLATVDIPEGVTKIKGGTFYYSALATIVLPESLEEIDYNAFEYCDSLRTIESKALVPPLCSPESPNGEFSFDDKTKANCVLYVPDTSMTAYQEAKEWKDFANIMPQSLRHKLFALTYLVDGEVYHTDSLKIGTPIVLADEPTKEGYTFSGWSEVPETMPAENVTISGTFIINKYLVTFTIEGEVIASDSLEYGTTIVAPEAPEKEGHTFNGWGEVDETVPAHDMTYEGGYTANTYKVYYYVGEELVHTAEVIYGEEIPEYIYETEEGYTFLGWIGESYETMPAHDVTYTANIESGIDLQIVNGQQLTVIYDLTGRKVTDIQNLRGGIYIINGKKVVVK